MPSLTDDMIRIAVTITPPGGMARVMTARFAYDPATLANVRLPPLPNPTDYHAIDAYTSAIRRRRTLVDCIGGDIAHQIIEACVPREIADEVATK